MSHYWTNPGYFTLDAQGARHEVPDDIVAACDLCGYIFHAPGRCPRCGALHNAQARMVLAPEAVAPAGSRVAEAA